jgi:hypothetical protein
LSKTNKTKLDDRHTAREQIDVLSLFTSKAAYAPRTVGETSANKRMRQEKVFPSVETTADILFSVDESTVDDVARERRPLKAARQ